MHWRRLRPCPSPCNPACEIGRCKGRSIDKGGIIGLDSSKLSKPPKLCLAQGYGAFSVSISQVQETVHYIEQQVEHHRTRTFQEEYLAFLKLRNTAHISTRNTSGISCAAAPDHTVPYGTVLSRDAFPGTSCQA